MAIMVGRVVNINCCVCGGSMRMMRVPGYSSLVWTSVAHVCDPALVLRQYLVRGKNVRVRRGRGRYVYGDERIRENLDKIHKLRVQESGGGSA